VDDRVGTRSEQGGVHRAPVEQVEHDRLGSLVFEPPGSLRGASGADHLVPALDELRDEPGSDGARGACDEHSHRSLLSIVLERKTRQPRGL
jgi:hypothetical protein